MPLYNYVCRSHGEFAEWRAMSESAEPAPCPACGSSAPRAISVPSLALMDSATRKAHHINERSADQPRVVKANEPGAPAKHGHGHDHGRTPSHRHGPSRPWMIGH